MSKAKETQQTDDYYRIEKAIRFVEDNFRDQPDLEAIAASVHLSKYHFQRLLRRWAGISPAQFMQFLTLEYAKTRLKESRSVLDVSFDSGLSGPGRLHDLLVTFEAMTPGEYKKQGTGIGVEYGIHPSPFGLCLLATTPRGICYLGFADLVKDTKVESELRKTCPRAEITKSQASTAPIVDDIFSLKPASDSRPFNLLLRGTNFQINVWKALVTIPRGRVLSHRDIAAHLGKPTSHRAVANAIAINPVAYLIPCHRVIRGTGEISKYRWGSCRKNAILGWEAARSKVG